mmetsp:Transcript_19212/g.21422  ORF Transcript_19212/g.21422 Transcript_19212/m.21422 type:complete len:716 (+) Transcript_19212:62-2209(+)
MSSIDNEASKLDDLEAEAAELDGYFSDASLDPNPNYPPLRNTFENAAIILNLPKVPEAKLEKLGKVVSKLLNRIGTLAANADTGFSGMFMPFSKENGKTCGFCFVEYESTEEAKKAVDVLQGYKFDKNHFLSVMPYTRALKLKDVAEFTLPEPAPFVEKPNATAWLEDPNQRDEFVVRHGRETIIMWSDGKNDPVVDYDGSREKEAGVAWCEYYCHWSPKGSNLATLVPSKGVILWSGKNYEKTGRFPAPGVDSVLFSPQENYLLTSNNRRDDQNAIKIFSIQTGELLRTFPLYPANFDSKDGNIPPPPFHWSHDDAYLARMGKDLISIFETPSMKLLHRRSLSADGIHEFQWSPKANVLAYWAPEFKNSPAHVDLIELPSRKKLRQKNLFNVTKCSLVWQSCGDYLGVKVTRHTKSKKTLYNNIELFRLNEPGVPVEMLDIKDAVMALNFEPRGHRFAMIHAENPSSTKVNVSLYNMKKRTELNTKGKKGGKVMQEVNELNKIETLEGKQCNCIFWSPAGQTLLMASLGESSSGSLEFYNADTKDLVVKEHYRCNQVAWDPSGRTVATLVSQPIGGGHFKFAMDNGFVLWSFQGKQLYQQSYETFYQIQWRPREQLLSRNEISKVRKNLKKYERQFDAQDKERQRALKLEETKGKRAQRTKYRNLLSRLRAIRSREHDARIVLLDGFDENDESNYTTRQITVETILSSKEETVM